MKICGIDKWVLPVYHKYLRDYHTRFNVFYGSAGSGKSYFVVQKIVLKALQMKRKVLVVRKVGTTLRDSIWALFLDVINQLGNPIESVNKTDFTITLINGSTFLFKSMDNPEKIKSVTDITDIVIEEATELTLDDFTQLNLRLRSKEPFNQIHLMFNPISKTNWCYKYFFEDGTPNDTIVCHTTYKDNPHLPKEYVDSLEELERKNPTYYRIYALGEFATLDKLVYSIYQKRIISKEETDGLVRFIGCDWGFINDPSAIIYGYFDKEKLKIYITGEYVKKGMMNDEIAKVMIDLGLNKDKSFGDSAEPKSIAELRQKGINIEPTEKGRDSVIHGIQWIQQMELIVDERCTNTIEELENYTWRKDKSTGEYINEPIDAFNHCLDALRYGLNKYIKGTLQPKIYVKPTFM